MIAQKKKRRYVKYKWSKRDCHGLSRIPEYSTWQMLIGRLKEGEITMDAEWSAGFPSFLRDMGARPQGAKMHCTSKHYSKETCFWKARVNRIEPLETPQIYLGFK